MKILLSGYHNPYFTTITEYMENAIKCLDHELIEFDDRRHVIPGRIRSRIKWLYHWDLKHINKSLLSLAAVKKPDIAIITGGHRITADTVKKLNNKGITTVLWTIDAPVNFQPILYSAPYYNHIVCQGTEAVEMLANFGIKGARWLPVACDPVIHKRVELTGEEKKKYDRDIVFVGSYYPNRWKILKELVEFDICVCGPGWNNAGAGQDSKLSPKEARVTVPEWGKMFSAAKIVLNIHYQDGKTPCYQASPRVFEGLSCGAFMLVDEQKDVLSCFSDGEHLVYFSDVNDLKEKIRYYLNRPVERKIIADSGQRYVLEKHTYKHRIKKLLNIIKTRNV